MITAIILILYLVFTLVVGVAGYRLTRNTADDYFLAGRGVGTVVLFFTLIATNFSAFFFLGMAGESYRIGYSYYGIMAFGTALVSLTFYFIGFKVWKLGKERGYITPPEMIGDLFKSPTLKLLFLAVMVQFTIPYLAIQPIGAGILLEQLTHGAIPFAWGATLLTLVIVFYVSIGGMRSVAWTDVMQGILMFTLMGAAVVIVGRALGGITEANAQVYAQKPGLFAHDGLDGYFTPQRWFSYMLLWSFAVPMFPQMFMRFFIPGSVQALKTSTVLYPIVVAILFLAPVLLGVLGHVAFPDLQGREADNIVPMLLTAFAPEGLAALIMVGALAAMMSTMDSQLLALSSMLSRDLYVGFFNRAASTRAQVRVGRAAVVLIAGIGLAIAFTRPGTIFEMATEAFTGLAVLLPTTVAGLYWKRASAPACIASILAGEAMLIGYHYEWIASAWTFGFLPFVPIMIVCTGIIIAGSALSKQMLSPSVKAPTA
ncbi:sodium:solute symporter family transporter [Rhodocaloribacter sp.]